jgi:CRISPR-associated protein Csb2
LEINAIACNGDIKNSSEWKPQESEFVNWAVALHRFLVKEWGIDPSPALVGKYAPGIARPANNVSIQIIDADFKQRYSQQIRDDVVKLNPGFLITICKSMKRKKGRSRASICF